MRKAETLFHKYLMLYSMGKSDNIHRLAQSTQEGFLYLHVQSCYHPFIAGPMAEQGFLRLVGCFLEAWASSSFCWAGMVGPGRFRPALARTP